MHSSNNIKTLFAWPRGLHAALLKQALAYGLALGALALLLNWLEYRQAMRAHATTFYVLCIALLFAALGMWLGRRLTPHTRTQGFVQNTQLLAYLAISPRECEVLMLLSEGLSNKLIARQLELSPNTVKTHVARLYEKLGVQSRTQAIQKARALNILP